MEQVELLRPSHCLTGPAASKVCSCLIALEEGQTTQHKVVVVGTADLNVAARDSSAICMNKASIMAIAADQRLV